MNYQFANWPAPKNVFALTTTRSDGFSLPPYHSNNLAYHVGDSEEAVKKNRQQLIDNLGLSNPPCWLEQTHSTTCILAEEETSRQADAAITRSINHPLVIMTADCLPITLCNHHGTEIGAIHAGWRGLFNGIVENTLQRMHSVPSELLAWIGPAISQKHYEVGDEVWNSFTQKYPQTGLAFAAKGPKWLANLPLIAEIILKSHGVQRVYQSQLCTFSAKKEFFSYRRESQTGRIATLIWFNNQYQDTKHD